MGRLVTTTYFLPAGSTADDTWDTNISAERAGWDYSALRVAQMPSGEALSLGTGEYESIVLPLEGAFTISVDGETHELRGRAGVFAGPTDVLYLPRDSQFTITSALGGRFALPSAKASTRHPVQFIAAEDVPVFVRGAGQWTRRIQDFGNASVLSADRLIAVEVVNPGGNWSGVPRHKHDTASETEAVLEEAYYFEAAPTPSGPGYGLIRVSSSEAGHIDITEEVRSGDTVLIPHGWHGPVTAPPETDLYYLNVMAGPTGRDWRFSDHPEDGWVRDRWEELEPDPRALTYRN